MPGDVETLFLRTLVDLQERANSSDAYEVLGISALLRKLLLDGGPLVDQVNRKYGLKLEYEICKSSGPPAGLPPPAIYSVEDGLDPDTAPPFLPRIRVKRDQLLKQVLLVTGGHEHSLRDVVLFAANVMGGVHAGSPQDEKEQALDQIASMFALGGYPVPLRQLKAIARVVLKVFQSALFLTS